jgi:hypothetical protein
MTSWKTTIAGILPIVGAIGQLATMASTGNWNGDMLLTDVGLISAGAIGLFAKDHNVSNAPTPAAAKTVP